ncbi:MAG: DoxX family protein [Chitinophagaceae bacterium]|nr:DoxX family protein [Chitinophagaceae bacterium]
MKTKNIIGIALRVVAAVILLQTLWFKFTGHPESVALFTKLGVDPWGRIFTGIVELAAGILLLWRPSVLKGAFLAAGLMLGAIASHFLVIGIESAGDGGQLFIMAWIVLAAAIALIFLYRKDAQQDTIFPRFVKRLLTHS